MRTSVAKPGKMSLLRRRYELAPQMRDYDALEEKRWLPYVMFFQQPNLKTASFTTDPHGFRGTVCDGKPLSLEGFSASAKPRGILLGSSTAFGVGASSDAAALTSLLNRSGDRAWFNFSGRAFNSTQELMIFLLHLPSEVETVLLFTGINHLVLSRLAPETSSVYNAFYFQSVFERGLSNGGARGIRSGLSILAREVAARLRAPQGTNGRGSVRDGYENAVACLRRDLRIWGLLRAAMGFRLFYVFQPVASWLNKQWTSEEEDLFSILDELDPQSSRPDGAFPYLIEKRDQFIADLRGLCGEFQVPFLDLNAQRPLLQNRWLFVDRAHLTDEGFGVVAQLVRDGCGL